jgi:hypothetical protein
MFLPRNQRIAAAVELAPEQPSQYVPDPHIFHSDSLRPGGEALRTGRSMNVVAWAPMMTTPQVEDDVLEGHRVQGDAIAYDPQLRSFLRL